MTRADFLVELSTYIKANFVNRAAADDFFGMQRGQIKRIIDGEYKKIHPYILETVGYREITPERTYEKV